MAVVETFHPGIELPTTNDYSEVEEGGTGGGRQGRATMPSTVYPEILVVADSAFYKSMGRSSVAVQHYLTSYFNAVNMRFATVSRIFPFIRGSSLFDEAHQMQKVEVSNQLHKSRYRGQCIICTAYDLSHQKD